jgi:hypothetical protein
LGAAWVPVVATLAPPRASPLPLGKMEGKELKELMLILCTLVVFCRFLPGNTGSVLPGTIYLSKNRDWLKVATLMKKQSSLYLDVQLLFKVAQEHEK